MKFIPPIQFPVRVLGTSMMANIEEQIGSGDIFVLKIRFSDGFEDIFYLDDNGSIYGSNEKAQPYEQSLLKDISILIGLERDRNYFVVEEMIEGNLSNIWMLDRSPSASLIVYAVYYNNLYRFELKRNGRSWIAFTKSKLNPVIDQTIRLRVEDFLNSKLF